MFVKHGCPWRQQSQYRAKSNIFTPPQLQGHVMSEKCEQPLGELAFQVWLLYHHQNLEYCTVYVNRAELQADRQMNRRTVPLLYTPQEPFRPGA